MACPAGDYRADLPGMDRSSNSCAANPLATGVKHPGSSAGVVQEVILIDLVPDHTAIHHMECQIDTNPGIAAVVFEHVHRININSRHGTPPSDIIFKETGTHIGFETGG